jgi:hypothetical protein
MMFARVRVALPSALAALICALIMSGFFTRTRSESKEGRLLSEREMAAIFGDAPGAVNNMCMSKQTCACTRPGSGCTKCDDENGNGSKNGWDICCASTGDDCNETGGSMCTNLFFYTASQWDRRQDCCIQCVAISNYVKGGNCNRADAIGNPC